MHSKKDHQTTKNRFKAAVNGVYRHLKRPRNTDKLTENTKASVRTPVPLRGSQQRVMLNLVGKDKQADPSSKTELRESLLMLRDVLQANFVYGQHEKLQEQAIALAGGFAETLDDVGIGSQLITLLNQLKHHKIKTASGNTWDIVVRPAVRDLGLQYQNFLLLRDVSKNNRVNLVSSKAAYKDAISDHDDLMSAYS